MSFNFIDEEEQSISQAIDPAPAQSMSSEVDDLVTEAERRFAKAKYYEVLIKQPIFEGDDSETAAEVFKEIQTFSRDRLGVLLGIRQTTTPSSPTATSGFTEEEVKILKQVASKLLKKPEIAGLEPSLRKAESPKGPQLRQAKSPQPKVQEPAKQQVPTQTPKQPAKRAQATGEVIEVPNADGSKRKYKKMLDSKGNEFYVGENGQRYLLDTNEAGQHYMKSINRQARPNGVQPIPSLTSDMMALVASRHVKVAQQLDELAKSPTVVSAVSNS